MRSPLLRSANCWGAGPVDRDTKELLSKLEPHAKHNIECHSLVRSGEEMKAAIGGSVCFVTGAAGGIGAGMVDGLLRRGAAKIYAADRAFPDGAKSSGWTTP